MRLFDYKYPVWTYTCADGPNAGDVIEVVQSSFENGHSLCAVRNTATNRVSAVCPEKVLKSHGGDAVMTRAHGIITRDGWGTAIYPPCSLRGIDGVPLLPYSTGERIWIEESLLPTDEDNLVPVVSLDTGNMFRVSSKHVCYVPELKGRGAGGVPRYITLAGPIHAVIVDGQAWRIQGYFERDSLDSPHAVLKWKKWRTGCSSGGLSGFKPLKDEEERRRVFESQCLRMGVESDYPTDQSHSQLEPDQLLSPEPKREEHLHTPPSRLPNPNLSKRALRTANVPYRPIPRRPGHIESAAPSPARILRAKRASLGIQCSHDSCHRGRCFFSNLSENSTPEVQQVTSATQPETTDDTSPVVLNVKIEFDPAIRHAELTPSRDSSEDYELV